MSEEEHSLVMPFVTVASKGGPHDDESYVAGWEMGAIDVRLKMAREFGLGLPVLVVKRASVPQLDLVAMKHGIRIEVEDHEDEAWAEEWACVFLHWATPA